MMEMIDNHPDSILYCEGDLRFDSELILISLRHHRDDWRHEIDDYIFDLLTRKCPLNSNKSFFLEYAGVLSTDPDFYGGSEDWIYCHLSEDLKSDEKFLNELNETLGLGDKLN